MDRRLTLQKRLVEILGNERVYFQPPPNINMVYPCIVYSLETYDTKKADNISYHIRDRYQVTHISRDPDSKIPKKIAQLSLASHNSRFVKDNLYHDVFTLYF